MQKKLTNLLGSTCAFLLLAASDGWACGTGVSTSIALVPTLGGTGDFQNILALNAAGQVAGSSGLAGNQVTDAFISSSNGVVDLGTLGGSFGVVRAMNASGQTAGYSSIAGNAQNDAFISTNGTLVDLGTLGGSGSVANAINNAGQVAGTANVTGDTTAHAYLYSAGVMTDLGSLGGDFSSGVGINNSGVVIGDSYTADFLNIAYEYTNGLMISLGDLGGGYSSARAINDAGAIVGDSDTVDGSTHAFLYQAGTMYDLGTLGGGPISQGTTLNNAGQVIGISYDASFLRHGFIYTNGVMTDLGTLGGSETIPFAINNVGQVIGDSRSTNGSFHAFLWQNGSMTDLNSLLPSNSGWVLQSGQYINDAGRIVGFGSYSNAFQWFIMDLGVGGSANAPTAIATPADQTVGCQVAAVLDATGSTNSDGDVLTYQWAEGALVLGTNSTLSSFFDLGNHTITLTVTDPCGTSSQTNVVVHVTDASAPLIVSGPGPLTVSADANCQGVTPNVVPQIVATDNCTPTNLLVITQNPVAGTVLGLGQHQIVVTVNDANGNSATGGTFFTVVDTTPPVIVSTPAAFVVSTDANCQGAVPSVVGSIVAADNCTPGNALVITQDPAVGTLVNIGAHSILVTVKDAAGNSATTNVSYTVADTTAPTIVSGPGPLTVSTDANCQGAVPNVVPQIVATDNCTPASSLVITQNPAAGTLVNSGAHLIVVTVKDAAGNSATANVSYTVTDTTAPVIVSGPGPLTVSTDVNCQGAVPNVVPQIVATDNCTPASSLVITQNPAAGTLLGLGQHQIVVTVKDSAGNSATGGTFFTVVDTTAPVIVSTPAPFVVSTDANCQGAVPSIVGSIVAVDNCTPGNALVITQNPAAGTLVNIGAHSILVTVKDAAGNSATATVNYTVADTTPPTILSLPAPITVTLANNAGCSAAVPNIVGGVVANDNCTPAGSLVISQSPAAGVFLDTGNHVITVTVKDAAGNIATGAVAFSIKDKKAPVITSIPSGTTVSADANGVAFVPNVVSGVVASDNCTPANQLVITQTPAAGTALGVGQYSIVVKVMDASGNSTNQNVSFRVVDTTAPVIVSTLPPSTVSAGANGKAVVPNAVAVTVAHDNSTPDAQLQITQNPSAGTLVGLGQHPITVTVKDASGNTTTSTIAFNVVDTTAPVISSVTANPNVISPGKKQLVTVTVSVTATDNSGQTPSNKIISITSNEPTPATDMQITSNLTAALAPVSNPGGTGRIYTITVQSTDNSGNSSTATVTVKVH
ncbi:MAG: hypothetical protein JWR26_1383 [Pedosphaera sp.]|nr:hypothetical protein [Pedosphaera sp.]